MGIKILFDKISAGLAEIHTSPEMSFCESKGNIWGVPKCNFSVSFNRTNEMKLVSCNAKKKSAVFSNGVIECAVDRKLIKGVLHERFLIKNISENIVFLNDGDFGIFTPFNDSYENADDCLVHRCHAHINACGASACVLALRMGNYNNNLGLALIKGSVGSYSVENPPYAKNDRGNIILNLSPVSLEPNEEYELAWVLFECEDEADFDRHRALLGQLLINLDRYNFYLGETVEFTVSDNQAKVYLNGERIFDRNDKYTFTPETYGEYIIEAVINKKKTKAVFYVSTPLDELVRKRIKFITEKQQYHNYKSHLNGAYLPYDNKTHSMYYSEFVQDHNACRERIGMGILIAKWLQNNEDNRARASLAEYITFVLREIVNCEDGCVYDGLGKNPENIRMYNAPWVCNFFCELYNFSENREWALYAYRVMETYYKNGGERFYPNAYSPVLPVRTLKNAGYTDLADKLMKYSILHADTIIKNGTSYPKHEVDYEQTIVAPAATILLGMYGLTMDERYLSESKKHLDLLLRFNGHAYDYRIFENSIRHWDDYWFGGDKTFADTFPHYWSVLSGYALGLYASFTDDNDLHYKAENAVRGSVSLFNPDGSATCAFVMPRKINEKDGFFRDRWANDQDFALYYALLINEREK